MKDKLKVLVVDDGQRMVKTICDILAVKGYATAQAYSGEEAVEKANSEKPDCVLMDIKMPGIDGVEAVRLIRSRSPDLPVLLMSAYVTREKTEEARRNGASAVLAKPINLQQFLTFLDILGRQESILIVDEDPDFCRTIKESLEAKGYRVETVSEADKVLGNMEEGYKLTVILDLKLGEVDGAAVLKDIRRKYPTKPVIMVTGNCSEMAASIEEGVRIGAYTVLNKPFETDQLVRIIREISRRKLQTVVGEPFCPSSPLTQPNPTPPNLPL